MPSHIYVALGMWDEAAEMNRRSYEAAEARDSHHGEHMGGHGWHALYWRGYTELQRGRFDEARRMLATAESLATEMPSPRAQYHLSAMRAYYVVETEDWEGDVAQAAFDAEAPAARTGFAAGWAALRRGEQARAEEILAVLQAEIGSDAGPAARAAVLQLEGLVHLEAGREEEALVRLQEAAAVEDDMPLEFGPPDPAKPAHELLGEVLLELDRAAEAQGEFQKALARAPRRMRALLGLARAAEAAGDLAAASAAQAELAAILDGADTAVRGDLGSLNGSR
jgi:tetratricopeptide (TPR) repeat protein